MILFVRKDAMDNPQAGAMHQVVAVPVGVVDHDGNAVGNGESLTNLVMDCPTDSVVLILNMDSGDASQFFGQTNDENGISGDTVLIDFTTGTINTDTGGTSGVTYTQEQIIQPGTSNPVIELPGPPPTPSN